MNPAVSECLEPLVILEVPWSRSHLAPYAISVSELCSLAEQFSVERPFELPAF